MTKIQIRRDTSSNWQQYNPTPSSGEPCYETDTGKLKIGNGTTPYNQLEYIGAGDLPDNVTTQGNTFNGAGQLVQLDSSGRLPAVDGSQLTNLPSSTPANMVTTDTQQTIGSVKTFSLAPRINNIDTYDGQYSIYYLSDKKLNLGGNGLTCNFGLTPTINDVNIATINDIPDTSSFASQASVNSINTALNGIKFWKGTQSAYDGITTKDENTLYIITGA